MKSSLTLKFLTLLAPLALAAVSAPIQAQTVTLVSGTTCTGSNSATFTAGGAGVPVSVCVTGPSICGVSFKLQSASAAQNGAFTVSARTRGASFDQDAAATITLPISITNPANATDLGAGTLTAVNAATAVKVADLTLSPQAGATSPPYAISLSNDSIVASGPDCLNGTESPASASFSLTAAGGANVAPTATLAATATLTGGTGSAAVTVATPGSGTGSLGLACTIPATAPSNFAITAPAGGNQTINAGATTATAVAMTCVPQAAAVNATLTCVQTPTPAATLPNLTSTITCPAAAVVLPTVTVTAAPASVPDNNTPIVFTVARTGVTTSALTVNLTSGVTGTMTGQTNGCGTSIIIPANASSASCNISANNTVQGDGPGNVSVAIAANAAVYTVGSPGTASGTITDDDAVGLPTVTVTAAPASVPDNNTPIVFTVARTGVTTSALTVNLTSGVTGTMTGQTNGCGTSIIIPANASSASCNISANNTVQGDGPGNVSVAIAANAAVYTLGSPSTATGTITNDDQPVTISVSGASATEGSAVTFTITCTGTLAGSQSIPYTISGVTSPDGPAPAGPASVACPGTANVAIPTNNDVIAGNTRAFGITLGTLPAGLTLSGPATANASAIDNDAVVSGTIPVPVMGPVGLGLLGLLIAGIAGFVQRRRK